LDSCRYDSFMRARLSNLSRFGEADRRWSYASWTVPAHYAFIMGLTPHRSPQYVYASEVYKKEFSSWVDRLGLPDFRFETFLPQLSLPKVLKQRGYRCVARVSMPVLNNFTLLNKYFDDYKLMSNHADFAGMVDEIDFDDTTPTYYFMNLGETHYPYMLKEADLPYIHGVHGVVRELARGQDAGGKIVDLAQPSAHEFITSDAMRRLHDQQVRCVEYVDELVGALFDKAPANTYFLVMADHGDAFGEDGFFGHGAVMHEKVFEVPFLEGLRP
jgi:hypothetical protein